MFRNTLKLRAAGLSLIGILLTVVSARAQEPPSDDATLDLAEPDFALVSLPTTLRLPARGGNFHLSHRFNENLRNDSFAIRRAVCSVSTRGRISASNSGTG